MAESTDNRITELQETRERNWMEFEKRLQGLFEEEVKQRKIVKRTALVVGTLMILIMVGILFYLLYCMSQMCSITEFPSVMISIPVASITVITTALLFGAFRRFDEPDINKLQNTALAAAGATGGQ